MKRTIITLCDRANNHSYSYSADRDYLEQSRTLDYYVSMSPLMVNEIHSRAEEFAVFHLGRLYPIKYCSKYIHTEDMLMVSIEVTPEEWENWDVSPSAPPKMCAAAGEMPQPAQDRTPLGYINGDFDAVNLG